MLNPGYTLLAFLGGRSMGEIARCRDSRAIDSSVTIGLAAVLSITTIAFGQLLFWRSIASTAPVAVPVALTLTVVYALFYRVVCRSTEVAGAAGKVVLTSAALLLAGVNALLAGHEIVLLPFSSQIAEMTILRGNTQVGAFRSQTESSLGLGHLREQAAQARQDEADARARLDTVPDAIMEQQAQAQACDLRAMRMRETLPQVETPGRDRAVAALHEQRRLCTKLNATARSALGAHRSDASERLKSAVERLAALTLKLAEAESQREAAIAKAAPLFASSATTGFGRHAALWEAVRQHKVPGWAAIGLMGIALLLESLSLVLKIILPNDEATLERLTEVRMTGITYGAELAYAQSYAEQMKPAIKKAQAEQTRSACERMVGAHLGPSMATRFAAEQFGRAAVKTSQVQQRSGQAATPVIEELAKVMPPSGHWVPGTAC